MNNTKHSTLALGGGSSTWAPGGRGGGRKDCAESPTRMKASVGEQSSPPVRDMASYHSVPVVPQRDPHLILEM